MLFEMLEEGDVHTCYVKASQGQVKINLELAARRKIIEMAEKKTGHKVLSDSIINLGMGNEIQKTSQSGTSSFVESRVPDVSWAQAHMWLYAMLRVSDGNIHSKVCVGNIMGDQISQHLHDMQAAWHHTQAFTKKNPIPLEFPLKRYTKDFIFEHFPKEAFPHIWICELPVRKDDAWYPCDHCEACNTARKTVVHWEFKNNKDFKADVEEHIRLLAVLKEEREKETHPEVEVLVDQSMKDVNWKDLVELRNPTLDRQSGLKVEVRKIGTGEVIEIDEQARIATNSTKPHHLTQCV